MNLEEGMPLGADENDQISEEPEKPSPEEEAQAALPPDPSPERAVEAPDSATEDEDE